MSNILLLGSTGYIGSVIKSLLINKNKDVITLPHYDVFNNNMSLSDNRENLISFIKENKIHIIINAAGYIGKPNIDVCELNKLDTLRGNAGFPIFLKNVCKDLEIEFGHISSGCLYDGYDKIYNENDDPTFDFKYNNCSYYVGSKVSAETDIKEYEKSYIWRIRLPFDNISNNRNYINKIMSYEYLLNFKNSISNRFEFANACIESIIYKIPYGIYNIVNTGAVDAEYITTHIKKYLKVDKVFKFISSEEFYNTISKIPRSNCILDNNKILNTGIHMSSVFESIEKSLKEWKTS